MSGCYSLRVNMYILGMLGTLTEASFMFMSYILHYKNKSLMHVYEQSINMLFEKWELVKRCVKRVSMFFKREPYLFVPHCEKGSNTDKKSYRVERMV